MASQQQEAEMGDGTNMVIVFAGELLKKAEELIRMGLKTSDIVLGYEKAQNAALQMLEGTSESHTQALELMGCRCGMRQGRGYPITR
jgi:chaperonin GroEL (HSP60 family)